MRRRLPLTILAALALVATLVVVVQSPRWRGQADGPAAHRPDGLARAENVAAARPALAEEPPCVASRLGLPCR